MKNPLVLLPKFCRLVLVAGVTALLPATGWAATFYVAPTGIDTNAGTVAEPFATIMKAQEAANTGDTIYLRGGTYKLTNDQITQTGGGYAYVNSFSKNGLSYLAYPGEKPVFDFTAVKPNNLRMCAFFVHANNLHFKGFAITGVQITIARTHTQSECIRVENGSHNTFDQLSMHDNLGIGIYMIRQSGDNLVLNCDAYNNYGLDSGSIGNSDGFGCHVQKGATGNVFRGCRSWNNSDDGYDCIHCVEPVIFDHCWSYHNGYQEGTSGGDGNGFKIGGWNAQTPPNPLPRHTVEFCLSAANKANGFYANHQPGQDAYFYNNTAFGNGNNFDMLERLPDNVTDVPGTHEILHNNLGFKARAAEITKLDETGEMVSNNFWSLNLTATENDFESIDATQMMQPRQEDGSLPKITFMHLKKGSQFIDKGMDVKLLFSGSAPDLGCFEYTTLATPMKLTAVAGGAKVTLTWVAAPDAKTYTVWRLNNDGSGRHIVNSTITATTFTDAGLTNGADYYYSVSAANGTVASDTSNIASATAGATAAPAPAATSESKAP